jgi:hypothetical protein
VAATQQPDGLDRLLPLPKHQRQYRRGEQQIHQPWRLRQGRQGSGQGGSAIEAPEHNQQQGRPQGQGESQPHCVLQGAQAALQIPSAPGWGLHEQQRPDIGRPTPKQ